MCGIGKCLAELQELRIIQVQEEQVIQSMEYQISLRNFVLAILNEGKKSVEHFQISEENMFEVFYNHSDCFSNVRQDTD